MTTEMAATLAILPNFHPADAGEQVSFLRSGRQRAARPGQHVADHRGRSAGSFASKWPCAVRSAIVPCARHSASTISAEAAPVVRCVSAVSTSAADRGTHLRRHERQERESSAPAGGSRPPRRRRAARARRSPRHKRRKRPRCLLCPPSSSACSAAARRSSIVVKVKASSILAPSLQKRRSNPEASDE